MHRIVRTLRPLRPLPLALLLLGPAEPAPALQGMTSAVPPPVSELPEQLDEVGIDQRLGESLPLDARFRDASGRPVTLGEYFGSRPVLVVPVYFDCPMLCTMVLNGVSMSLRELAFTAGEEYEVVVFSFNPADTPEHARDKKKVTLDRLGQPGAGAGWHFLTGGQEAIRRLTDAMGFRYRYNQETGEFAHTAGIVVATPEGRIARYFFGISYPSRDVRLGMVEAADGTIGSVVDQALLYCFRYDPATGKYSAATLNILRLLGAVTVLVLVVFVLVMLRRERLRNQRSLGTA